MANRNSTLRVAGYAAVIPLQWSGNTVGRNQAPSQTQKVLFRPQIAL